jgi:hypothetical protein
VPAQHLASACYLAGGLAFRVAWVEGGKASAADHEAVARTARGQVTLDDRVRRPRAARRPTRVRRPLPGPAGALARGWTEAVRRTSLAVEGALRRGQDA